MQQRRSIEPEPTLAAGGSLRRPAHESDPSLARRLRLSAELALFYIGAPLGVIWAVHALHVPLFLALPGVLLCFIAYLLWDDGFRLRRELAVRMGWRAVLSIIATFLVLGAAVTYATWVEFPSRFLAFPLYRTEVWQVVMVGYPLVSVIPQELVYRTFFFHRYGPLFGESRWLAIAVNGALFGYGHIIFDNAIAILGTTVIGALIAYRYQRTRCFWAAWLEHSLYGALVFTVGLGGFFFTGISNLR